LASAAAQRPDVTHSSTDHTVVSLADFRVHAQHGALGQIEAYWEGLRNGRIMPARSEVDPRGISGVLEHAFILERVARGIGRFRLAGMHLNDIMGMEVRGMPLTALILPESRDAMGEALAAVFDEPAIVRLTLASDTGLGRGPMDAKMALLPLRSDLGDVSRVLGCFVANGKVGRAPRRFAIAAESRQTLIGFGEGLASRRATPRKDASTEIGAGPSGRPRLVLVPSEED
jgi:hypothetical protein